MEKCRLRPALARARGKSSVIVLRTRGLLARTRAFRKIVRASSVNSLAHDSARPTSVTVRTLITNTDPRADHEQITNGFRVEQTPAVQSAQPLDRSMRVPSSGLAPRACAGRSSGNDRSANSQRPQCAVDRVTRRWLMTPGLPDGLHHRRNRSMQNGPAAVPDDKKKSNFSGEGT